MACYLGLIDLLVVALGVERLSPNQRNNVSHHSLCGLLLCAEVIDLYNKDGNTPLHIAAYVGDIELVNVLLSNGANADALNYVRVESDTCVVLFNIHWELYS